jgi:hypothetical protein
MARAPSLHFLVHPTALSILRSDLPKISADVAEQAANFTVRRIRTLPSHMRIGVTMIAAAVRLIGGVSPEQFIVRISHTHLPLISEYFRLIRSLSYAFIWETWPDTRHDGSMSDGSHL